MRSIGFGAYDGYHSTGFGEFGMAGNCGQVGELCKDKVKKEDIQELIDRINDHKDCAEKSAQNSNHPCRLKTPLKKTIEMTLDYIERLSREGNRQAANYLSTAVDEMGALVGLPSGGYQRLVNSGVDTMLDASLEPWNSAKYNEESYAEIAKYMYWSLRNAGTSGGALKFVVAARDSIYFIRNITPAEDARRANTIRQLIEAGKQNKHKLGQASALLKKAWITEATRKQLQSELNEAYKVAKVPNPDASNFQILGSAVFSLFAPKGQEDIYMDAGSRAAKDIQEGKPLQAMEDQKIKLHQLPDYVPYATQGGIKNARELHAKKTGENCFALDVSCHYKKNKYAVWAVGIGAGLLLGYLVLN